MVARDPFNGFIAVYMMASRKYGTIYTGVTSRLPGRAFEHRDRLIEGFTKKYGVHRLVWYEPHESMVAAIRREKRIKKYPREWKINLIERENPNWDDLYPALVGMHRTQLLPTVIMGRPDRPSNSVGRAMTIRILWRVVITSTNSDRLNRCKGTPGQ